MRKITIFFLICVIASVMLVIGCERKVVIENEVSEFDNCFVCHGEDGLILAAQGEWQNSIHASGNNVDYTNRGGTDCTRCHDHQGFLEYLATGEVGGPYENVSAIHCFTCHAPHTTGTLDLRTETAYELEDGGIFDHGKGNLCVTCHHSRRDVNSVTDSTNVSSTHWGPHHGPQGDLLEGTGGYEYAGYTYNQSNHKEAVTDACIGCHMGQPNAHQGYNIGGHSFNMEDPVSGYDLSALCEDCHADADGFDFPASSDFDHDGEVEGYQTEIEGLVDSLGVLLFDAGLVDEDHHPVVQVVADGGQAGALYNFLLAEEDRSHGVHNYRYIVDLLQSAIEYMD